MANSEGRPCPEADRASKRPLRVLTPKGPPLTSALANWRALPNRREILAWGMYDLANQSYTLLVITLFYGIHFRETVVGDMAKGDTYWALSFAVASLIVVAINPVLGALADFTALKKRFLMTTGVLCAGLTVLLAYPGRGDVALAVTLLIASNVCFMMGEVFLAGFLPELAPRHAMGLVSAVGWTMGYVGGLIVLPLSLVVPGVLDTPPVLRWTFVLAGVWFFLAMIPTAMWLRERKAPERLPPGRSIWTIGFVRLAESLRESARFKQLAIFLTFFLIYACGMQVIIVFSGIIAGQYLAKAELVLFAWALAAVAGVGAFATGVVQDRLGLKATVAVSLVIWIATALGAALLPEAPGGPPQPAPAALKLHIWAVGVGIGLGLGITGAGSRAIVASCTPAHKTAEFFSLWGMGYRIAGIVGPPAYSFMALQSGQRGGMLLVTGFFVIGLVGLAWVNVAAGRQAAEGSERRFAENFRGRT